MIIKSARQLQAEGTYAQVRRRHEIDGTPVAQVRHGAYVLGDEELNAEERHRLLVSACLGQLRREGGVVSHVSAAVLLGLPVHQDLLDRVWVTRPNRVSGHHRQWLRTFGTSLEPDDITIVDGIAVTGPERTVVDVARHLSSRHSIPVVDALLHASKQPEAVRSALCESIDRHPRRRGNAQARWAVGFADCRSESWGESVSRVVFAQHGLPAPELQYSLLRSNGEVDAVLDFYWSAYRVGGEFDGLEKYAELLPAGRTAAMALRRSQNRDEAIKAHGIWPVHWGAEQLAYPNALVAQLWRAMRSQAA